MMALFCSATCGRLCLLCPCRFFGCVSWANGAVNVHAVSFAALNFPKGIMVLLDHAVLQEYALTHTHTPKNNETKKKINTYKKKTTKQHTDSHTHTLTPTLKLTLARTTDTTRAKGSIQEELSPHQVFSRCIELICCKSRQPNA